MVVRLTMCPTQPMMYSHTETYLNDAGVDLVCPVDEIIPARSISQKIRLGVHCRMDYSTGPSTIPEGSPSCFTTGTKDPNREAIGSQKMNPSSYYLLPRSSTGSKTPLRLSNSVGVIDAGYRGEIIAVVDNNSDSDYHIKKGDRLFQIVSPLLVPLELKFVDLLSELGTTDRGEGGFGSTGN